MGIEGLETSNWERAGLDQCVLDAADEWERARTDLLALPIGAPNYRSKLNDLSNAEDALARAVREGANRG